MQRNRIDRIKSLEVTKYNATDMSTSQENTTISHDSCTIHFLTLYGYKEAYGQFLRQFKHYLTNISVTDEYIESQLVAPDLLQLLPLLRSYLPYLQIINTSKPTIQKKFYNNIYASIGMNFIEAEGYKKKKKINRFLQPLQKKKDNTTKEPPKAKKDPDISKTYVSSVLNDINAITFTTQYQLQLDLLNGMAYTQQDISDIINHRRLLTPALYKKALRNDDYEHILADALIESGASDESVTSILQDLPLVILSDAERMFLKDLINDTRANWLLSQDLCQLLSTALEAIDTTFPSGTWKQMPTMTDDTPSNMTVVIQCLQAIHQNVRINIQGQEVSPCRLEYSVGSNGYTLIAYHHARHTFTTYPLHDINSITMTETPRLMDIDEEYITYCNESKQTITFTLHDANNAVDRCFNYFSNYTIQAKGIDSDEFTIEVKYLPFQEQDILHHLLKLGYAIRIIDESPLRQQLDTIYQTAIRYAPQQNE